MNVVSLPAYLIASRPGARRIDDAKVAVIADSIKEVGLLSPIIVVPGKRIRNGCEVDGWDILAGQHRFKAMFEVLRWEDVPCVVYDGQDLHVELVMIDENLMRHELSDAERSRQLCRRKEIYETLHPETAHGATGGGHAQSRQNGNSAARFTKATAEATGQSERVIQRAVARGKALGEDLERVKGTSLDKANELDALAILPADERQPLIERAQAGEVVSARMGRPERPSSAKAADDLLTALAVHFPPAEMKRLNSLWKTAGFDLVAHRIAERTGRAE